MKEAEAEIAQFLVSNFIRRGWREIELDVHDVGGAQSYDGRVKRGWLQQSEPLRNKKTGDVYGLDDKGQVALSDLLFRLREMSESEAEGPWYHARIVVHRSGSAETRYWWEGTEISSPSELIGNDLGLPVHPFKRRVSASLLEKWPQDQLCQCVEQFVRSQRGAVPPSALRLYAASDWLADANNGGHNQYFSRSSDWLGAGIPKGRLIVAVHEMLSALGQREWLMVFEEAVGLWSHFVPGVDAARLEAQIPPVPRREQSDLDSRFFEVSGHIYEALNNYVKLHIAEFANAP